MKRQLAPLSHESDGFDTLEEALAFCMKRPGINRAWIGHRTKFHVFVAAINHHRQFYHIVADYQLAPQVVVRSDEDQ